MSKCLRLLTAAALSILASSCIEHQATIRLNKDGSGTIVEETTFGGQALAMLGQMAALGGDAGGPDPMSQLVDEEAAKERATGMGEGVTVEKVEPIDEAARRGGRVTYAFKDINQVTYLFGDSISDAGESMNPAAAVEAEDDGPKEQPLTFKFADGVLTFDNPGVDPGAQPEEAPEAPEELDAASMAMAQQMFQGMRLSLKIEAPAGIEETNATHVEGNTVTLVDMDMGKLVEDPEKFKALVAANPQTPKEMQEAMAGVEGVKVETEDQLTIELK